MDTPRTQSKLLIWFISIILLQTCLQAQTIPSCSGILQDQSDGSLVISVRPPLRISDKIHLNVRLYSSSKQTVEEGEEVVLLEDKDKLNERLLLGNRGSIKYKLKFTARVPAAVEDITLNHNTICKNENGQHIKKFEINLAHSFYISGKPKHKPFVHLDLTDEECGRPDRLTSFIHHGNDTTPGEWPWHSAVYWKDGIRLSYKCGGTLITPTAVLTAAHCVTDPRGEGKAPGTLILYVGKYRLSQYGDEVQAKEVKTVHVYPTYNSSTFHDDIAIVIFRSPARMSSFVKPACVWGQDDNNLIEIVNKLGYVLGWGYNENGEFEEILKMGAIPVVSVRECLTSYVPFTRFTTSRTFCAGFRNGTHNPCGGDSGGGMFFMPEGAQEWVLRGVVSTGASRLVNGMHTCDPNQYSVFTDVMSYREWIVRLV